MPADMSQSTPSRETRDHVFNKISLIWLHTSIAEYRPHRTCTSAHDEKSTPSRLVHGAPITSDFPARRHKRREHANKLSFYGGRPLALQ